jgi:hypothetical protein
LRVASLVDQIGDERRWRTGRHQHHHDEGCGGGHGRQQKPAPAGGGGRLAPDAAHDARS